MHVPLSSSGCRDASQMAIKIQHRRMEQFTCVANLERLSGLMSCYGRCHTHMLYTDDDPGTSRASYQQHGVLHCASSVARPGIYYIRPCVGVQRYLHWRPPCSVHSFGGCRTQMDLRGPWHVFTLFVLGTHTKFPGISIHMCVVALSNLLLALTALLS